MAPSDDELLFIGSTCHLESCKLNDFLPLSCSHCSYTFCSSHFLPEAHQCAKWDQSAHNRVAPNCPFCNVPVAYPAGSDPNVAMEKHFDASCEALGKSRASKKGSQVCAHARCNKVLISPIRCQACNKQFCPEHRFPATHVCANSSSNTAPAPATKLSTNKASVAKAHGATGNSEILRAPVTGRLLGRVSGSKGGTSLNASESVASAAPAKVGNEASSKVKLPFSKTDRRAKAEQKSSEIALRERARKGLLSEEEKVKFAEMEASKARDKPDSCIIV